MNFSKFFSRSPTLTKLAKVGVERVLETAGVKADGADNSVVGAIKRGAGAVDGALVAINNVDEHLDEHGGYLSAGMVAADAMQDAAEAATRTDLDGDGVVGK